MKNKTEVNPVPGHTPGPWFKEGDGIFNLSGNCLQIKNLIARCSNWEIDDEKTQKEAAANARLIAAAPELLEAVKYALELMPIARQYFPKSIKNSDTFKLENTCATLGKTIQKTEGK